VARAVKPAEPRVISAFLPAATFPELETEKP